MEIIGKDLYLKPHTCLDSKNKEHTIIGACDIEVHSAEDYLYIIDVARLLPPDINKKHPNSIFYQQFRPEFIKVNFFLFFYLFINNFFIFFFLSFIVNFNYFTKFF